MDKFGIYIHIPFCNQACSYCNFYYSTTPQEKDTYINAVCKELAYRAQDFDAYQLQSIYFGGGTPSLLPISLLEQVLAKIHLQFKNRVDALEITLEANPNNINTDNLLSWKKMGINRLSIGIQSFYDTHLQFMNRSHSSTEALQSIPLAQDVGFENLSTDLIFGFPLLQDEELANNVEKLIDFKVPHISAYALTIEPKTLLFHKMHQQKLFSVDEEQQSRQFLKIETLLGQSQYEHYEISNYALPHFKSLHNTAYWNDIPYLGIGASAHSFLGNQRMWNIANHHLYSKSILEKNTLPLEKEILTKEQQFNEFILLSLRQSKGIDLSQIQHYWGKKYYEHILSQLEPLKSYHWITTDNSCIKLSTKGKLYCDKVILFFLI